MPHKRLLILCLPAFLILTAITACGPGRIKTTILMPAKSTAAAKVRRIAVLPFDGPWYSGVTQGLSARVEALLASIRVNDEKYFVVVDRQNLDRILREQEISLSAAADPKTAVRIGKVTGVEALLTGTVVEAAVRDEYYTRKTQKCASSNKKGVCTRYYEVSHRCTERTAILTFIPKLVDVTTGHLLFSESLGKKLSDSACPTLGDTLWSKEQMIAHLTDATLDELSRWLAPYPMKVRLRLKGADKMVKKIDEVKAKFKIAVKFAGNKRLDRACELWAECHEITRDDSIAVLFNMGVCREIAGDFQGARDFYVQADKACVEPDSTVSNALKRIQERLSSQEQLDQQMGDE